MDSIEAFNSAENYPEVCLTDGKTYLRRAKLTSLEHELQAEGIVRIHRSVLVNKSHVRARLPVRRGSARQSRVFQMCDSRDGECLPGPRPGDSECISTACLRGESSLLTDSKTAAAVNCLVIEPTRNTVSTLMGTFSSRLALPYPRANATRPCRMTSIASPTLWTRPIDVLFELRESSAGSLTAWRIHCNPCRSI